MIRQFSGGNRVSIHAGIRRLFRPLIHPLRHHWVRFLGRAYRRYVATPLEELPDSPDLFRTYRSLCEHPEVHRRPGGWEYRGRIWPDFLTVGGASCFIFSVALRFCQGKGVDVGAGHWPLPGSIPIDATRGPGLQHSLSDVPRSSLDYVFSSHCLEHIVDWKATLSTWIEKLRPGGVIFLYLPHPDGAIWNAGSPFVGEYHKWNPTPDMIRETLEQFKCEVVEWTTTPDALWSFYMCARIPPPSFCPSSS